MEEKKAKKKVKVPADGKVIKGSGGTIYVMEDGFKRLIPDRFTYVQMGIKADYIVQLKDEDLDAIPEGNPMPTLSPKRRR